MTCDLITPLSVGSWSYTAGNWTAYPITYKEKTTELGLTAEGLNVSVLCTVEEWQGIREVFNTWRDARLNDEVDEEDGSSLQEVVGSTVEVSCTALGVSFEGRSCYFMAAPQADSVGMFVQVTFELVDAAQWVAIYNREKEVSDSEGVTYCGTFNLWGTTLKLRKPAESYQDMPQLSLTAGGRSYTTGPRTPTETRVLEGDTDKNGWNNIVSQCYAQAAKLPGGDWFPVTPPAATVTKRVEKGVRNDLYTVSISVAQPQI
jgi:hypothetical protein